MLGQILLLGYRKVLMISQCSKNLDILLLIGCKTSKRAYMTCGGRGEPECASSISISHSVMESNYLSTDLLEINRRIQNHSLTKPDSMNVLSYLCTGKNPLRLLIRVHIVFPYIPRKVQTPAYKEMINTQCPIKENRFVYRLKNGQYKEFKYLEAVVNMLNPHFTQIQLFDKAVEREITNLFFSNPVLRAAYCNREK